jgi:hypothetical protein
VKAFALAENSSKATLEVNDLLGCTKNGSCIEFGLKIYVVNLMVLFFEFTFFVLDRYSNTNMLTTNSLYMYAYKIQSTLFFLIFHRMINDMKTTVIVEIEGS